MAQPAVAKPPLRQLQPAGGTVVQQARPQEPKSAFWEFMQNAQKFILLYLFIQIGMKYFLPKASESTPPMPGSTADGVAPVIPGQVNPADLPPITVHPAWPLGTSMNLHFFLSTSPFGDVFRTDRPLALQREDRGLPTFVWENVTLGDWDDVRSAELTVNVPTSVQHNASLWAHIYMCKNESSPNPSDAAFNPQSVHHVRKLLSRYMPKKKEIKGKSLLANTQETSGLEQEEEAPRQIGSFWHPNITLGLVSDNPSLPYGKIPPAVQQHVYVVPNVRDGTGTNGYYTPILFGQDFWHLSSQYTEINTTTATLPLRISLQPLSYFKFQLFTSFGAGFDDAAQKTGGAEIDELKRMLLETNPYFLALTGTVSVLHVVFEMLAFTSDVSHWRKKEQLVGVSLRTIIANVIVQGIIMLYLLDNNEETSWMIIFGQGTGALIELWKITKAVDISIGPPAAGSRLPFKINITDKHVLSEDERKTQEYDRLAFRYVSYVTLPLLACYTIYSLVYETHRGWYSFLISTLTTFVYMFGFVQLVPQLIINYKLKSVAHMPIKAMVYKTLSTVVDDLFAFCIKMPMLHRLACFRDDVVFLVFIYQRWIYRIDPTRVNEYGQVLVGHEKDAVGETKKDK